MKDWMRAILVAMVVGAVMTNGLLWNRPKPQFFLADLHPAYKDWVVKELNKGNVLVGVLEVPGLLNAAFGSVRIYAVRLNPTDPGKWEWRKENEWVQLPHNTVYHLE